MTQTLHILKKDFRQFGFEIGLAMLLLVLYTWSEPANWSRAGFEAVSIFGLGFLQGDFWGVLLIMGWIIILVRLFQEEAPAGDRQFWITRPYRWPSLLVAKVLFILAVMSVPLLIAQMILLRRAGFSPLLYLPGVLLLHTRLLGAALILIALAVVSAGFRQVSWAILLFLLYLGSSWWMGAQNFEAGAWHGFSIREGVTACVLFGVPALVIVRQHWVRRTVSARLWLLGGLLAVVVLTAAMPYHRLIDREYPPEPAGEEPLFQFHLEQWPPSSLRRQTIDGEVSIDLDLTVGKLTPGYVAELEAMEISLEAPNGTRWSSGWRPTYALLSHERFETSDPHQTMWVGVGSGSNIWMKPQMFARMKDQPLKVRVIAATRVFRDVEGTELTQTEGQFAVPGTGMCVLNPGFEIELLTCRAPLRMPRMVGITTRVFRICPPASSDLANSPLTTTGWLTDQFDSGTVLTPIVTFIPNLRLRIMNKNKSDVELGPCPGVPLSFREPQFLRRERVKAEFEGFKFEGGTPGTLEEKK